MYYRDPNYLIHNLEKLHTGKSAQTAVMITDETCPLKSPKQNLIKMTGLEEMAHININTTVHNEAKSQELIHMAKRRRSSAANQFPSPQLTNAISRPPTKKKHGFPVLGLERNNNTLKDTKFSTLRDVVLFALQAADNSPKYLKIKNRCSLDSVVLLTIPGLDAISSFGINHESESPHPLTTFPSELEFLGRHFKEFAILSAPGDRESIYPLMRTLAIRPYSKSEKTRITATLREQKLVLPDLRMTHEDLIKNDYPIHPLSATSASPPEEGWVDTERFDHDGSHTFALDCEMCESESGKVLTRVSVIDFDERIIMDEYVKPSETITDYLTQFSGITEEILSGVTTTLQDIQAKLTSIISADDYIIGHSLENDLKVMKIRHPNIVDTSVVFEHPRGPPYKSSLKYLTKQYLQRVIQGGEHDSVEDAKACLDLVKLKLVEGGLLGKVIDGQPIFEDLSKIEKRAVFIDRSRVQPNQESYIQCSDDDGIVESVIEKAKDHNLIVANLKAEPENLSELNRRLSKVYRYLDRNTLFIVASGNGDQTEMRKMAFDKRNSQEPWTDEDEEKLRKITKATRLGVCFFKIV